MEITFGKKEGAVTKVHLLATEAGNSTRKKKWRFARHLTEKTREI